MAQSHFNSESSKTQLFPLRFVILNHIGIADPHFDLMIESAPGGELLTWRCPENPLARYLTIAHRLGDHRRAYLEYEGELSGGRGLVTRVAGGLCAFQLVRER